MSYQLTNLLIFSSSGTTYEKSSDGGYGLFVRRSPAALLNVYVNGKRLSADGTSYRIIRLPNGMFKIVLSREMLSLFTEGRYTLRMEFDGLDDIETVIEVKAHKF